MVRIVNLWYDGKVLVRSKKTRFPDVLWFHYLYHLPTDEKPISYARFITKRLDWTPTHPKVLEEYTLKYYVETGSKDGWDYDIKLVETFGSGKKILGYKTFCDDQYDDFVYYELILDKFDETVTVDEIYDKIPESLQKVRRLRYYRHDETKEIYSDVYSIHYGPITDKLYE